MKNSMDKYGKIALIIFLTYGALIFPVFFLSMKFFDGKTVFIIFMVMIIIFAMLPIGLAIYVSKKRKQKRINVSNKADTAYKGETPLTEAHKEKLNAIIEELRLRTEKTAYRININTSGKAGITDSKYGGLPYWNPEFEYPVSKSGKKLYLLAQINFDREELHDELLPDSGMLQFFLCVDDYLPEPPTFECQEQDEFRVIYHPVVDYSITEEQLRKLEIPANTELKDNFPFFFEYPISLEKTDDCIGPNDTAFNRVLSDIMTEKFNAELKKENCWSSFGIDEEDYIAENIPFVKGQKMLGYPDFAQYDPREDRTDEDKNNICNNMHYDTLLLQIDSQGMWGDPDEIMIGDCGVMNFFINSKKLKQRDFSDVFYTWDCC